MSENWNRSMLAEHKHLLLDQGSYFMVQNPAPGTGFASAINAAYSNTSAFISIFNSAAAILPPNTIGNSRRIYIDYIRLIVSAVGATTTSAHAVFAVDNGNRYVSGTASTPTPVNPNMDAVPGQASGGQSWQNSVATVQVGPLVTTATAAQRLTGRAVLRVAAAPAWVLFDEVVFHFGHPDTLEVQAVTPTTATRIDVYMPPVCIGPQQTFLYQPFNIANATTPPSFEYEIGWWER